MAVTIMEGYRKTYPDLPSQILEYFQYSNLEKVNGKARARTIHEFIDTFRSSNAHEELPQPHVVVELCRRLAQFNWITEMHVGGGFGGLDNSYYSMLRGQNPLDNPSLRRQVSCAAYGFPAAYDYYSPAVLPIVHTGLSGNKQIGSSFVTAPNQLITAFHCISDAEALSIKGVAVSSLRSASFYTHINNSMDLACIIFKDDCFAHYNALPVLETEAEILTQVMALGYPDVPGFHPAVAAEAATISARITQVQGRVASTPTELWARAEMLLITARVRGGFSGGPVLDSLGQVTGVVSREPSSEDQAGGHRYDNAGYGTAIPSSRIREMLGSVHSNTVNPLNMENVTFEEFE